MRDICLEYIDIAERLIDTDPDLLYIKNSDCRYTVTQSDRAKTVSGAQILGECETVPSKYAFLIPYDFIITIYEKNIEELDQEQLEILIKHELLHIGIEYKSDKEKYYIAPHDIEDFYAIINKHGLQWNVPRGDNRGEL